MASRQPTIHEFLAKPRQARSNVASVILIDDSSEESGNEQEPDAVASQEEVTCSASISGERTGVTTGEKKAKTLRAVVRILSFQWHRLVMTQI